MFAGPSLRPAGGDLVWRGPASHGDLARAVAQGATHLGFIDGLYEEVATVRHKEILDVLDRGVHVVGGGSLGAIRAAECGRFGMIGVGSIHARYASGELDDDAAVAQLHAPAELGYAALTEALVNVEATLGRLSRHGLITAAEEAALLASARSLFFKERTHEAVVVGAGIAAARTDAVLAAMDAHRHDVKREDAAAVVEALRALPSARRAAPSWPFARTRAWARCL